MSKVRAKFRVQSITAIEEGYTVHMEPVTTGSPENEEFFKYTPYGSIKMGTINSEAVKQFHPGQEVYVDFTPITSEADEG